MTTQQARTSVADLTTTRATDPGAITRGWAARERRPLLGGDGRMLLVAADHPARGALGVGSRDAPAKPHDKRDKGDRCGDQHQAAGSSDGAQHVRIFAQFLHGCHQLRTHSLGPGWINVVSKEKATARRRMRSRFSARAPGVTMAAEPRPKSADGRST